STIVSATIGTTSLCLGRVQPWGAYRPLWWVWWLGDAMSALVLTPVLLTWAARPAIRWHPRRLGEAVTLLMAVVAVSIVAFTTRSDIPQYPLVYLVFPFVIWAALRFGQRGTTAVTVVVSGIAIWGTVHGFGSFGRSTANESLIFLQLFMAVVAVSALLLGAAITERNIAERHRAAGYAVTQTLAESATLDKAAPKILQAVCESLQWDLGAIWRIDHNANLLRPFEVWHHPSRQFPKFEADSRQRTFASGIGLPGRVWANRSAVWIADVTRDANFPRAAVAAKEALHAAFGFPIVRRDEVLGIIEFFSHEIQPPDTDLLNMMTAIGSQIGQFMDRKRAEEELQKAHNELEKRIAERTAELSRSNELLKQQITKTRETEETVRSLLRISENLNSTLDVDTLLDVLVEEAIKLTGAESGCSGLRTPEGMACYKYLQKLKVVPFEYCWSPGQGLPGWVIDHKTPYVTRDAAHDKQMTPEMRSQFGIQSAICTPILDNRGEAIAFFEIHNKKDGSSFTAADQENLRSVSQTAALAIQNALAYQKVQQAEMALRQLSGRLLQLQDEERRRLARELHDTTGQTLAALVINLSTVKSRSGNLKEKDRRMLAEILELAEECSREIRTLSYLLHPPALDELGLTSTLRWYVEGFVERSGIQVDMVMPPKLEGLPQEAEVALFRIVQESLTNINRHSGSSTAGIRIAINNGEVMLEVKDQGRGMPPRTLEEPVGGVSGLGVGIAGMRERIRQLGGRLEIDSGEGGTTVKAMLPVFRVKP
ncbi:MAG TPA: GAF domain-containing protein, partial [Acidobacteriota bacterium]